MVAVRDNPCMEPYAQKRLELLAAMPVMRDPDCKLHIIDDVVTMDERVAAWRLAGGQEEDVEAFRAGCALTVRSGRHVDVSQVEVLDLENTHLRHVDLSPYTSLRHLRCDKDGGVPLHMRAHS